MKTIKYWFFIVFCGLIINASAQETCKVLKAEIAGTYKGDCKKGLANGNGIATGTDTYEGDFKNGLPHGQGKYVWASGEVYNGRWKEGMRNGIGKYIYKVNNRDSTLDGIWDNDQYKGPKPENPYRVVSKEGVERFTIKRVGDGNKVLIDLFLSGSPNTDIADFMISSTSGSQIVFGRSIGFENVIFPVTMKFRYKTWNKLHTMRYDVMFEYEIKQAGEWQVAVHN